jgi:hypothetical protein
MRFYLAAATAALALAGCEVRDTSGAANESGTAAPAPQAAEAPAAAPAAQPAPQQAALGEADSDNGDFRLAATEATRSNGVLTVKARVTLLGGETGNRRILYSNETGDPYLISGDQKYMMLKDNEGVPLTVADGFDPRFDRLGDTHGWWAKFPAPPPEVRTVSLYFKGFAPIENLPITDR